MDLTELGMKISVRWVQEANASSPIEVTFYKKIYFDKKLFSIFAASFLKKNIL